MNTSQFILKSKGKLCGAIAASLLIGISQTHATQIIRELWDGAGKTSLAGKGSNASSGGLSNSTTWVVSPPGNTGIQLDGSWNLDDWMGIDGNTVLGNTAGSGGTFAFYGGNMNSTLINAGLGSERLHQFQIRRHLLLQCAHL